MKVLGLYSLKLLRPVDFHGYFYYLWSLVILGLTYTCLVELTVITPISQKLLTVFLFCLYIIVFVYVLMMIDALINEKKILEIVKDFEHFDQQVIFKRKVITRSNFSICWISYTFVKALLRFLIGANRMLIAITMIVFLSDMLTLSLVGMVYEQLSVRYTSLCDKLSSHIKFSSRDSEFSQLIESIRIDYFFLGRVVRKINTCFGFRIFGSLFNRHLHCIIQAISLLKFVDETFDLKRVSLLIPDEFFPIIYLTSKAELLENKVRCVHYVH